MKRSGIRYMMIGIFMVITITFLFFGVLLQTVHIDRVDFNQGWDVDIDSKVTENCDTTKYKFPHILTKGDMMVMTNT